MKSKKFIGALAAIVMSASFAAGLTACNSNSGSNGGEGGGDGHSHHYTWVPDADGNHCHEECDAAGECDAKKKPSQAHVDVKNNTTGESGADGKCDNCNATLNGETPAVTGVSLDRETAAMIVGGDTLTLTATVTPAGAGEVTWNSSDPTVATVEGGVVTALKAGSTTITASVGGHIASCEVTVNAAVAEMTAESWEQALTFSGKVGFEQNVRANGREYNVVIKADGNKFYSKADNYEAYVEMNGDTGTMYTRGYAYWTKEEVTAEDMEVETALSALDQLKTLFPFDKFEEGEANGEYVSKDKYTVKTTVMEQESSVTVKEAKLVFSGGKLISTEYSISQTIPQEGTVDQVYSITLTYGETLTMPAVIEGEKVTAEEWVEALALKDNNYRMGVCAYGELFEEFRKNGTDCYLAVLDWNNPPAMQELYYSKENGKFYQYECEYGHWLKYEIEMTDEEYAAGSGFDQLGVDLSAYPYEAFTYDEAAKAYTCTQEGTDGQGDVTVTAMFKDKKLVWAKMVDGDGGEYVIDLVYGDAEVNVPEIAAGEQVSDAEWSAAFAMDFDNVEINVSFGYGEMHYLKVGGLIYQKTRNMERSELYTFAEGGKYYQLEVKEGVWVKSEIGKDKYDEHLPSSMFSGLSKSDFTYDAATGTYKSTQSNTEIKFVDKKLDTVVMVIGSSGGGDDMTTEMYFSYGTAEITLPEEGSEYEGGNQGGGDIGEVDPPVDMTADEWSKIFEEFEKTRTFELNKGTNEYYVRYAFDEEIGCIYLSERNNGTGETTDEYVYAAVGGTVFKFTCDTSDVENIKITKTETSYASLAEIKSEIINGMLVVGDGTHLSSLHSQFRGTNGNYYFNGDSVNISVYIDNGKLAGVATGGQMSELSYRIDYEYVYIGDWYLNYAGSIVSEEEWNNAFAMNCQTFHIIFGELDYAKDGNIYRIKANGEADEHYYVAEGGEYFRYDQDVDSLNWAEFTKVAITEDEFNRAVQAPSLGDYAYGDFSLNEEDAANICYQNAELVIVFYNKKLSNIKYAGSQDPHINISYDEMLTLPQAKMTEGEWTAAIEAAFAETNLTVTGNLNDGKTGYDNYFDLEKGVIFRDSRYGDETEDQLFIEEGGTLYKYTTDGNSGLIKEEAEYSSLQALHDYLMQEILKPSVLNGQTIAENYSNFDYYGSGRYSNGQVDVVFTDGKMESVNITTWLESGEPGREEYIFQDYGVTDVNDRLPYWYLNNIENENK